MRTGLLTFVLMAAASPARAQDPRIGARFSASDAARLTALIDSAGRENLPTDPLVLRALEGQAKSVPLDRIVDALDRLRDALHTAQTTLGAGASVPELTTAAAALQAGVPGTRLAELRQLRGGQPLTAPLGAYLDLVASGVSTAQAWRTVTDLAKRRASDGDYVRLTNDAAGKRGHPPAGSGDME